MNGTDATPLPVPSARHLGVTTAIALLVAAMLLITIVLPAEYGIDPLGTGERLGLTAMARPANSEPVKLPEDAALKPVVNGPTAQYSKPYKVDAIEFKLGPYDYIEYKYALEQGAQLQFSWTASVPVIHEFHGELGSDPNQVTSFDKSTRQESHGAFTAPFTGIHGWYWENPGGDTITVTLKSSGFYASSIEFRSDKTTVTHQLKTP